MMVQNKITMYNTLVKTIQGMEWLHRQIKEYEVDRLVKNDRKYLEVSQFLLALCTVEE